MGDVDVRAHIGLHTATALGRDRAVGPALGRLYSEEISRYSFYRRLYGPQDQSGHEGLKKNLHSCVTRDRTRAVLPVVKRFAV